MKVTRLFWKLFPTYFLISLFGLFILLLISRYALINFLVEQSRNSLLEKANIFKQSYTELLSNNELEKLSSEIKLHSKQFNHRVTIIDPKGTVLVDSNYESLKMENHRLRPEIISALEDSVGTDTRKSSTLRKEFVYLAVPLKENGKTIGILRNSVSIKQIIFEMNKLGSKVLLWSFILVFILSLIIYFQTKNITDPLEQIEEQVQWFTDDNFDKELVMPESNTHEVQSLALAITEMGKRLSKQFNKILKNKNAQEAIFKSMAEGVLSVDLDLRVKHFNRATLELFNFPADVNLKGKLISEIDNFVAVIPFLDSLPKGKIKIDSEVSLEQGRIFKVTGRTLLNLEGDPKGTLLVFHDMTQLRLLETHRKDFVANVSHELKTPLTAIQGFVENLKNGEVKDEETRQKFLNIISKHAIRLNTIIEDLLSLSNIERESEVNSVELFPFSLNEVIKSSLSTVELKASNKKIEISFTTENDLSPTLRINSQLLEQAFVNLIDNAIKYSPEHSEVKIKVIEESEQFAVEVQDQGPGIEVKHHDRLFERFYSVDKARSRQLGGSGLGLAIVKHIVLAHNGEVGIRSELNKGSTFIIYLPKNNS
ncbi:ATP-binding protein [Bacteriovoracaceae bacterium]|nr:ATP-binding protein [Bacteriovoracaceae bacterium]